MKISASMLYNHVQCPHRVRLDLFGDPAERDAVSPFVEMLWEQGNAFEQQVVDGLEIPFENLKQAEARLREKLTLEAMAAGSDLIYGGRITAGDLVGEPDLLRRVDPGYAPGDIKSGAGFEGSGEESEGKPKKHYAVQLALYADILGRRGLLGEADAFVWDVHGEEVNYDLDSLRGPRSRKTMREEYQDALEEVRAVAARRAETTPALSSKCKQCHWRTFCLRELMASDDLTLIPELGRGRRDKLLPFASSVADLAAIDPSVLVDGTKSRVQGIGASMLAKFRARARLQKQPDARPYFVEEVELPPDGLELFFDVETDPMRDVCYLHGFVERSDSDPATEKYVPFFADAPDPDAEKAAFAGAWAHVAEKRPTALYYYSSYELTTWRRLARRYPDVAEEEEVMALFDSAAAFDLYGDLVSSKMIWPTRDHSIKTVAALMGFSWRDADPSGASSIQWYHEWVEKRDRDMRLRILEYNEDDCIAMRVLIEGVRAHMH